MLVLTYCFFYVLRIRRTGALQCLTYASLTTCRALTVVTHVKDYHFQLIGGQKAQSRLK
jgi:hypothetical protein